MKLQFPTNETPIFKNETPISNNETLIFKHSNNVILAFLFCVFILLIVRFNLYLKKIQFTRKI